MRRAPGSVPAIGRLARAILALVAFALVFSPGPVEKDADTGDVTAAVLSPISDAWQAPPAVPTVAQHRRIAVVTSCASVPTTRPCRALTDVPVDLTAHELVHGDARRWRGPPLSEI